MDIKHVSDLLECCYNANHVAFLWGQRGMGKSQSVMQFVRDRVKKTGDPFDIIDIRLGQMEVGDLIGIPRNVVTGMNKVDGLEVPITSTVYGKPQWWPEPNDAMYKKTGEARYCDKGIVFFDEFNRADTNDVVQGIFQIILAVINKDGEKERRLHTHVLPEGWRIVCAGNPDGGNYSVNAMDIAMLDRFVQIEVTLSIDSATAWQRDNLEHDIIWKFCQEQGTEAFGKIEPVNMKALVQPSHRSWEFMDDMLKHMSKENVDAFGLEVISGIIGEDQGMMFYQYMKENLLHPITAKEVMDCADFQKFCKDILPIYVNENETRLELLDITTKDIAATIGKKEPSKEQVINILLFAAVLPRDMTLALMKEISQHENVKYVLKELQDPKYAPFLIGQIEELGFSKASILKAVEDIETIREEYEKEQEKK